MGIHLGMLTLDFLADETSIDVRISEARELEFPAVTVCNANPVKKSALIEAAGDNPQLQELLALDGDNEQKKRRKRSVEKAQLQQLLGEVTQGGNNEKKAYIDMKRGSKKKKKFSNSRRGTKNTKKRRKRSGSKFITFHKESSFHYVLLRKINMVTASVQFLSIYQLCLYPNYINHIYITYMIYTYTSRQKTKICLTSRMCIDY
jgi:hypothetical protein